MRRLLLRAGIGLLHVAALLLVALIPLWIPAPAPVPASSPRPNTARSMALFGNYPLPPEPATAVGDRMVSAGEPGDVLLLQMSDVPSAVSVARQYLLYGKPVVVFAARGESLTTADEDLIVRALVQPSDPPRPVTKVVSREDRLYVIRWNFGDERIEYWGQPPQGRGTREEKIVWTAMRQAHDARVRTLATLPPLLEADLRKYGPRDPLPVHYANGTKAEGEALVLRADFVPQSLAVIKGYLDLGKVVGIYTRSGGSAPGPFLLALHHTLGWSGDGFCTFRDCPYGCMVLARNRPGATETYGLRVALSLEPSPSHPGVFCADQVAKVASDLERVPNRSVPADGP